MTTPTPDAMAEALEALRREHWTHWSEAENSMVARAALYLRTLPAQSAEADPHPPSRHCMCADCAPSFEAAPSAEQPVSVHLAAPPEVGQPKTYQHDVEATRAGMMQAALDAWRSANGLGFKSLHHVSRDEQDRWFAVVNAVTKIDRKTQAEGFWSDK